MAPMRSEIALVGRMRKDLAALMHLIDIDDQITLGKFKIILERLKTHPGIIQDFIDEGYQHQRL